MSEPATTWDSTTNTGSFSFDGVTCEVYLESFNDFFYLNQLLRNAYSKGIQHGEQLVLARLDKMRGEYK